MPELVSSRSLNKKFTLVFAYSSTSLLYRVHMCLLITEMCLCHLNGGLNGRKLLLALKFNKIKIIWVISYHFNPLTPRCAEFSRWLQCRTIYRKKMKKDWKLHILPFLGPLFRMAQSEFSKNYAKLFIFPQIPKKTLFLGYDFF